MCFVSNVRLGKMMMLYVVLGVVFDLKVKFWWGDMWWFVGFDDLV